MTYYDLLKQYVSTGLPLSEYQFDKIKNDGQLLNSYFYNRNKGLMHYSLEKYEVEFVENNPKYFSRFDQNNLIYFMKYSSNPDELAKMIIKAKGDKLDSRDIYRLLFYSKNPYEIARLIGMDKVNKYIYVFDLYFIEYLLENSPNPDEIAKLIINAKGNDLDSSDIEYIIQYSYDKEKTKNLLIQAGIAPNKIPD